MTTTTTTTMTILPWAGVGRNTLRLLRHFWDCQQVVAKQGGCYGEAFKPTRGTTQGDVISPTLFNIEVDAILRCWFLDLGLPDSTQKSLKPVVQDFHVLFYVDDGYVGSSISPQLQTAFDKLIQLFDRVGLRTNPNKTKAMTCTPGYLRAVAYKRRRLSCRKITRGFTRRIKSPGYSNQDELMDRDESMDGATVLRHAHLAGNKRVVFTGVESVDDVSSTPETVAFGVSLSAYAAQLTKWNTKSGQDFLRQFLHGQNAQDYWFCLKSVSRIKANEWQTRKIWQVISALPSKKLEDQVAHAIKRSIRKRVQNQGEQEMEGLSVSSPVSEETQDEQEMEVSDVASPVSEETQDEQEMEVLRLLDMPIRPGHAQFLKRIRLATDVTDFEILYNELDFMIGEVDRAQLASQNRWDWCVEWALARHFGRAWADVYEMHRKTVLKLLEYLWRRYEPDVEDPDDFKTLSIIDVCKEFGTDKIDRILKIFLPMDKANAFYKMSPSNDKKDPPGLAWYCKLHTAQELRARGVTENTNGRGPLNRRYVQLWGLSNQYLNDYGKKPIGESWEHLMVPQMPPNYA